LESFEHKLHVSFDFVEVGGDVADGFEDDLDEGFADGGEVIEGDFGGGGGFLGGGIGTGGGLFVLFEGLDPSCVLLPVCSVEMLHGYLDHKLHIGPWHNHRHKAHRPTQRNLQTGQAHPHKHKHHPKPQLPLPNFKQIPQCLLLQPQLLAILKHTHQPSIVLDLVKFTILREIPHLIDIHDKGFEVVELSGRAFGFDGFAQFDGEDVEEGLVLEVGAV
jgi:hypothetical protein